MTTDMTERESPFARVRGSASPERIRELKGALGDMFHTRSLAAYAPEIAEQIKKLVIPQTQDQRNVLAICNEVTNEFLKDLGLPAADIPVENFLIIPHHAYQALVKDETSAAGGSPFQGVVLVDESSLRGEPLSYFASTALHEMVQLKGPVSFWAYRSFSDPNLLNNIRMRQWGLSVMSTPKDVSDTGRQKIGLQGLEEAVVSDIQKLLFKKVMMRAPFKKERDAVARGKERRRKAELAKGLKIPESDIYRALKREVTGPYALHFPYYPERQVFEYIVKEIQAAHPNRFKSPDDVKTVFHRAHFTLRILEIGRLIKHTFGPDGLPTLAAMTSFGESTAIVEETLNELKELRKNVAEKVKDSNEL